MTSGRLWNYYRDETDNFDGNAAGGKSFECKTKIGNRQKDLEMKQTQIGHQYQL